MVSHQIPGVEKAKRGRPGVPLLRAPARVFQGADSLPGSIPRALLTPESDPSPQHLWG